MIKLEDRGNKYIMSAYNKNEEFIGRKFGRLTVLAQAGTTKDHRQKWLCECECGKIKAIIGKDLKSGHTRSCGCLALETFKTKATTHGMTKTKEYRAWCLMKNRCYQKKNNRYQYYGGKGIKVCDRWLNCFEKFYNDMGKCPDGYSIDRIDPNKDYSPENCRWADTYTQANNKTNCTFIEYNGEKKTITQWARAIGMNSEVLRRRIKQYHWSIEKAITTPWHYKARKQKEA